MVSRFIICGFLQWIRLTFPLFESGTRKGHGGLGASSLAVSRETYMPTAISIDFKGQNVSNY
jgi:hypothetical protein